MDVADALHRMDYRDYLRAENSEEKVSEDVSRYSKGSVVLADAFGGLEKLLFHRLGIRAPSELPLYGEERVYEERRQFSATGMDLSKPETVKRVAALLAPIAWPELKACFPEVVKQNSFMRSHSAELYEKPFTELQKFYAEAARNDQVVYRLSGYEG